MPYHFDGETEVLEHVGPLSEYPFTLIVDWWPPRLPGECAGELQ